MQLHPRRKQRAFQRASVSIVSQGEQHVRGHRAGAGTRDRLVGTLAAGISVEGVTQHGFARSWDMRRPYNKVKIG